MIRVEVKGLKDLEYELNQLGEEITAKILRDAGREALAIVRDDMKEHAGYDKTSPGPHMRDSIKIRSTNRMKDETSLTVMTLKVGPSKEHHMKALAQEFGTSKQIPKPFIRPALDYNRTAVLKTLVTEIRAALSNYSK
ncbi:MULTISPECIES: HK97-gp10 family putative phage morphogenesis protein [Photorhabdus]|uniref:HK97-gp10 family putative phage morphogenesis protein n=1 Tax=Photorhabdus TaxID=29487 RepID=UPI0007B47902